MNPSQLSRDYLEEALNTGIITLSNGDIRELKTSEILAIAKFFVKDMNYTSDESASLPEEMFSKVED